MQNYLSMRYLSGVLLVLVCACAPAPRESSLLQDVSAGQLLDKLRLNSEKAQSLRGLARVDLQSPEKSFGASQVLLAEKPDRLRAETLSMFGQPVLLLAANGGEMRVLVPGQNRFYQGPANGTNLRRFARIPLRLTDIVHLLHYQVPILQDSQQRIDIGEDGPRLELAAKDGQGQILDFDTALRLVRCRMALHGHVWLDIHYRNFSDGDDFPYGVEVELPDEQVSLEIEFKQLELNPQLDSQRFVLARPAGSTLIELPGE